MNKGIKLNNIVSNYLEGAFPRQDFIFKIVNINWEKGNRNPIRTETEIKVKGRLQQVAPAMIKSLINTNIITSHYYQVFISELTPTQADILTKNACSEFIYNNDKYKVVGTIKWNTNDWQQIYCYKLEGADNGR